MCMSVVLSLLLVGTAWAYPDGAPVVPAACEDMYPQGHFADTQTDPAPYILSWALEGSDYRVTIDGAGVPFKGILIQARYENDIVANGQFSVPEPGAQWKTIDCQALPATSATHTTNEDKLSIGVLWSPLGVADLTGLRFVATVVQSRQVFWQFIESAPLA